MILWWIYFRVHLHILQQQQKVSVLHEASRVCIPQQSVYRVGRVRPVLSYSACTHNRQAELLPQRVGLITGCEFIFAQIKYEDYTQML